MTKGNLHKRQYKYQKGAIVQIKDKGYYSYKTFRYIGRFAEVVGVIDYDTYKLISVVLLPEREKTINRLYAGRDVVLVNNEDALLERL